MKEYSIAFYGNITVYAESEEEARKAFEFADVGPWAEIDTVQLADENPEPRD
jgi:hypothetical protein